MLMVFESKFNLLLTVFLSTMCAENCTIYYVVHKSRTRQHHHVFYLVSFTCFIEMMRMRARALLVLNTDQCISIFNWLLCTWYCGMDVLHLNIDLQSPLEHLETLHYCIQTTLWVKDRYSENGNQKVK